MKRTSVRKQLVKHTEPQNPVEQHWLKKKKKINKQKNTQTETQTSERSPMSRVLFNQQSIRIIPSDTYFHPSQDHRLFSV